MDYFKYIKDIALDNNISTDIAFAKLVKSFINNRSEASKLIQFVIDMAGDQFISEEYYQKYPDLLSFLYQAGCEVEEIQFRSYIYTHPDILICKDLECRGRIIGGCPKMWCETCGKKYFLKIEDITEAMCESCTANHLNECTNDTRKVRYQIHAIKTD